MSYKILFSIPIHEKLEVVLDQIANIFTLNENCAIILHLSPVFDYKNSKVSLIEFEKMIKKSYPMGGVIINPESVRTGFFDIIQAHISNFRYATSIIDFEYIALLASNELFIKPGLYEHIQEYDVGVGDCIIPITTKRHLGKSAHADYDLQNMLQFLHASDIYTSQVEGSYYKKYVFSNICDVINRYFDYKKIGQSDLYAREEVYFATVFWGLYKYDKIIKVDKNGMFTYVPWRRPSLSVWLKEAIRESGNKSNIYCIKRVARNMTDPVRVYIRQKYDYGGTAKTSLQILYLQDICKGCMWWFNTLVKRIKRRL